MIKPDCIHHIRRRVDPNAAELSQVDWKSLYTKYPDYFIRNTFLHSSPFALICPDSICANPDVFLKRTCQCRDSSGDSIPNCYPKAPSYPVRSVVCIDPKHPSDHGTADDCAENPAGRYALSCYCCCAQVTGVLEANPKKRTVALSREEPTNLQLAGRLGKSMLNWGKTGFAIVSDEIYEKRMAACRRCDQLREPSGRMAYKVNLKKGEDKRRCGSCGCIVSRKAKLPKDTCPLQDPENPVMNRWGEPWRMK